MRSILKFFLGIHAALYRLSKGKIGGGMGGVTVVLLTTTGRKSGKTRTVPLGSFKHQDGWIIVGSNNGGPHNPDWYYNLKSRPQVSVQIMDKVLPATAQILTGEARAQAWQQVITTAPGYARYEKRTEREIPLVLLRTVE